MLYDESTPAGTFVNEQRIAGPTPLRSGDVIRVGRNVLVFGNDKRSRKSVPLVPTLRVGTHVGTLRVPLEPQRNGHDEDGTRSVPDGVPTRSVGTRKQGNALCANRKRETTTTRDRPCRK